MRTILARAHRRTRLPGRCDGSRYNATDGAAGGTRRLAKPRRRAARRVRRPCARIAAMTDPILRAEALTKIVTSGDAPLTILDDVSFDDRAGRHGRDRRRVRLRQDDAARPARRPRPPDVAARCWSTARRCPALDEDARAALRQRLLGFVFQSFQLLPALTALENVMLPLELAGADDAEPRARVWLARVGLAQAHDALSAAALRRRAAARRDRARVRRRAEAPDGRRADRQPRRRDRRRGRRPHVPAQSRARHDAACSSRTISRSRRAARAGFRCRRAGSSATSDAAACATLAMQDAAARAAHAARATGAPASLRVLIAALVLAVGSVGTVGFFADRVKGALDDAGEPAARRRPHDLGRPPAARRVRRRRRAQRGLATTPVIRFNSMVPPPPGASGRRPARCSPTSRRSRDGYPLRGAIMLADRARPEGRRHDATFPTRGEAWPDYAPRAIASA